MAVRRNPIRRSAERGTGAVPGRTLFEVEGSPRKVPAEWAEEDPGLPIEFGPASNAEYDPEPVLPPVLRETIRRARSDAESNARRLGMSRREFLLSAAGAATTFLALNACTREEHGSNPSRTTS